MNGMKVRIVVPALVAAMAMAGGGAGTAALASAGASPSPIKVGWIVEKTGLYASYITSYDQGFTIGLQYATNGTNKVNGHPIQVNLEDDADDPTTAVTDFKSLVGAGYKIIGGTGDSGIADELYPLAAQNKVVYISGAAADDAITGANKYTFRSGRQTYQDVATAASYISALGKNKKVVVLAQDYSFGQSYVTDTQSSFKKLHDHVSDILVPLTTSDFTGTATQVAADHPNIVFLAWAGATAFPLIQSLANAGVFSKGAKVITGLATIATYPYFTQYFGTNADYLSLYVSQGSKNAANTYLVSHEQSEFSSPADLFASDGFVAGEEVVRAAATGGASQSVNSMIKGLSGWKFLAPKGMEQIRAADHALLQPMYQVSLSPSNVVKVTKVLSATQTAPPVTSFRG
jgi:branched-chain amino acid transport system substrate-binding protein